MRWLLDDGPFGTLAKVHAKCAAFRPGVIYVVESVAKAVNQDQSGRREEFLHLEFQGERIVEVIHASYPGPALNRYLQLRPDARTPQADIAEHEAVSILGEERPFDDLVFVAQDKGAVFLGLAELGPEGLVGTPFDVWLDLKARGWISHGEMRHLVELTQAQLGNWKMANLPTRCR